MARQVNRLAPDVVFSPMQTMGSWGRRYQLLLTLHDLIYYRNRTPPPEFAAPIRLLWRLYHLAWWPQRLLLNRADAVVTVSETIGGAHRDATGSPDGRSPWCRTRPTRRRIRRRLPRTRALVYMGSFMPYKNVEHAGARDAALLPDHELHLMSRIAAAERARLTALGPGRAAGVPRRRRRRHLPRACCAGRPRWSPRPATRVSGIPLVEAMGLGTPLVVSDIPVFREVGGDAAAYVDPDDAPGFVAGRPRARRPGRGAVRDGVGRGARGPPGAAAQHYSLRTARRASSLAARPSASGERAAAGSPRPRW